MLWLPSELDEILGSPQQRPRDAAKAAEWFEKAAKQKHTEATYQLAKLYESGNGVKQNKLAAFENNLIAAEKGHPGAQYAVGLAYFRGAPQDPQGKCTHRYLSDDPNYGKGNYFDRFDTPFCLADKDSVAAALWWQRAAEQGHADAQFQLARLYVYGEGVATDKNKSAQWLEKAAGQGNAEAQYILGVAYETGDSVPKDASIAAKWFIKAAIQGQQLGQWNIARLYTTGDGIEQDKVLAYAWANLAASNPQGGPDQTSLATKLRTLLEQGMSRAEISEAQRISSSWKPGQTLKRESARSEGGAGHTGKLEKTGTGTLFMVGKAEQAITNQHVVNGCAELRIEGREGVAKLVTEDKINDLALIQIPGKVNAIATIAAKPEALRQGEDIVVFGFPLNAVLSSGGNLTPGVVSALTGLGNNTNQLQITAPIQPGSSGSPVLNKKGEVVGVVNMKLSDSKMARATGEIGQNVNFAISGQTLKAFLDKHKAAYRDGAGFFTWEKDTADLAEDARRWTLVVECWR